MKHVLVLFAVIALGAVSTSQFVEAARTHHRPAEDRHCSQLEFQLTSALPSYDGPGFSTVDYSNPDEPVIVPRGCFQFSCARNGDTYQVLSCPNLKVKTSSRTLDSTGSPVSMSTKKPIPASNN